MVLKHKSMFSALALLAKRFKFAFLLIICSSVGNIGVAQTDVLAPLTGFICNLATTLQGPVALALGVLLLAAGGITVAIGGKRSLGFIVWAAIGITVATGAATIATSLFSGGCP